MRAILLMGGYGTRLMPLTLRTPKALLPLAGEPLAVHHLKLLEASGVDDIVLSLNVTQRKIEDFLGDGARWGVSLGYVYEKTTSDAEKLGSVGAMRFVADKVGVEKEQFVMAGDNYLDDFDFQDMLDNHRRRDAMVSMGLYKLEDPDLIRHYSAALLREDGRIERFQEKPSPAEAVSDLAGAALYLLDGGFLEKHLPEYVEYCRRQGVRPDRIGDLWSHFVDELPLYGYQFEGTWMDIGNVETYLRANTTMLESTSKRIESDVPRSVSLKGDGIRIQDGVRIAGDVSISGPVLIEKGSIIGGGSDVGPNVYIGRGSELEEDVTLRDSILFENVSVGSRTEIEGTVVDGESHIGESCTIGRNTIVGFDTTLEKDVTLHGGSRIWPSVIVGEGGSVSGDVVVHVSPSLREELSRSRFWED